MAKKDQWKYRRRRYIFLLVVVCIILGISLRMVATKAEQNRPKPAAQTNTAETAASTTAPTETLPAETLPDETADTDEPSEDTTETETGEASLMSSDGRIRSTKEHIYVRAAHSQEVELSLLGVSRSDIAWRVSDDSIADVEDGIITGLEQGDCMLYASYQDSVVEIPVTVRQLTVHEGCTYVDGILVANKSYSLPRDYDPGDLPVTQEAFQELSDAAADEGLNIFVYSGYRSYDFQVKVYNSMVNGYSKEYADRMSARPGYSEHQTGYTIDCNMADNKFASTAAGKWLAKHCWEYGFIIRYPEGKEDITGYDYESWHIRYVGYEHAKAIWEQGITLEEYLDITSSYDENED